nr:diaminopimelate epimerase [Actinoalloteichus spitiensis]
MPDRGDALELTSARVRALCDRRVGLGADGVLRVVRSSRTDQLVPSDTPDSCWFMDYRNADGSAVEMCGNGVRVFASYLVHHGLQPVGEFVVGTRAGGRRVVVHDDATVTVDMGRAAVTGRSSAVVGDAVFDGVCVDVGNPHLACVLDASAGDLLDEFDLSVAPVHDTEVFPNGVNVEFVRTLAPGRVRMRVHERGVGETRSCGTGTVAAVAAALSEAHQRTGTVLVETPGGPLTVTIEETTSTLTGPAVLVASGRLADSWWREAGREPALARSS